MDLRWLGEHKEDSPHSGCRLPNGILRIVAEKGLEAVGAKVMNEWRDPPDQAKEGKDCQRQVPRRQGLPHDVRLPLFHVLGTQHNAHQVDSHTSNWKPMLGHDKIVQCHGPIINFPAAVEGTRKGGDKEVRQDAFQIY